MKRNYRSSSRGAQILQFVALALIVVCVVSAGILLLDAWDKGQGQYEEQNPGSLQSSLEYNGTEYVLRDNLETMLILGLDTYETPELDSYNNTMQADFLLLVVVDNANSSYSVLQINRDTMVEMSVLGVAGNPIDTVTGQIALAHTYGNGKEVSCRNVAEAVSDLLMHINVDHYVSATMSTVSVYNDHIGGVEVEVLDDFTGIDDTLIKGQKVLLTGEQALRYVRARQGMEDSTNIKRMARQRQYLKALYEKTKLTADGDSQFAANAFTAVAENIVTDCSATRLQTMIDKVLSYEFKGIVELEGSSVAGETMMEFYPTQDSILQAVTSLFYTPKP